MNQINTTSIKVLFICLLLSFTVQYCAATTVSIADITADPGDVVTVPIRIDGIEDYGTATINLEYDSSVVFVEDVTGSSDSTITAEKIFNDSLLKVLSQNKGSFLSQDGASTVPIVNNIDGIPIEYGEMRMGTDIGVITSGTLTAITFEVIGDPGASELHLADVMLSDLNATKIPGVTVRTGRVGIDQPSTPFVISGHVTHGDGSECNDPVVNVTNLNTSREWAAVMNESSNYYQIVLASPDDAIVGDVLRFEVVCGDKSTETEHTVTQAEVDAGGFEYNITLEALPGDLNGDGEITSADAVIALQMAVCGERDSVADVNHDGSVTSLDALMIMQAAAGHITFDG
ncbi:MAG: dockerin type I domain-containing protein [Candidatus Aerophobetes bacterium]|nr:dockerin type I domain-containing protein [Candidatus Aerophobetes bacterium]